MLAMQICIILVAAYYQQYDYNMVSITTFLFRMVSDFRYYKYRCSDHRELISLPTCTNTLWIPKSGITA